MPVPTTGNQAVDAVVRERMTEAIGIVRQVISEALPNIEPQLLDRLSVTIPVLTLRPLTYIIIEGLQAQTSTFGIPPEAAPKE